MTYPKLKIKEALAIREKNTGKKLTQRDLSKMIDHTSGDSNINSTISRASKGSRDIYASIVSQIADICGVTTDFLLGK